MPTVWETSYMETALQRFTRLAVQFGGNARDSYDKEIQRLTGTKGKLLYDISRGKSTNPSTKTLQVLAEVIGQPIDLLQRAVAGEDVEPIKFGAGASAAITPSNIAEVIALDMTLSMGDGTNIDDYVEETTYQFDIGFIRSFTSTPPHRLRIATGIGDSMFPTLMPSDAVWFDTTQTMLKLQDKIWACSIRGGGAIKRLRIGEGRKIIVLSDNPTVPEDFVSEEDVRIFGRVLRLMRDL